MTLYGQKGEPNRYFSCLLEWLGGHGSLPLKNKNAICTRPFRPQIPLMYKDLDFYFDNVCFHYTFSPSFFYISIDISEKECHEMSSSKNHFTTVSNRTTLILNII